MTIFNNKSNCCYIDLNELKNLITPSKNIQQKIANQIVQKIQLNPEQTTSNRHKEQIVDLYFDVKNNNLQLIINDDINLTKPIYIINQNDCSFNISINVGKNSRLAIIEHKIQQNNTTHLNCLEYSDLDYYLIQEEDSSEITIDQYANSKLAVKLLSSKTTNNTLKLTVNFRANDAILDLNVLQNIKQNVSNKIDLLINHLIKNNHSSTIVRTMTDDHSCANLTGKIIVNKKATKTIADLQSKSLILNKHANVINCPELDIYNNDVICTHGSSIGHLDLNALFYMQSRGMCLTEAKQMLTTAFMEPIIKKINYSEIIDYLNY